MTTQLKSQFNLHFINEEKASFIDKKEKTRLLEKPKNFLHSLNLLIDDDHFANNFSQREEENYIFSHNDFSDLINKRLDEYSDDEYSYLKKEIDSFIQINQEEAEDDFFSKNKRKRDIFSAKKCKFLFLILLSLYISLLSV